ncbi:MAG TPA: clan AA aspartic protease [Polyangia bacterium]|nr:clan AA aspartic protease [Polyangia bacterium]
MTKLKMWNLTDLEDLKRGLIPPDAVREMTVEALVDTGAVSLVIPEDVAHALGLSVIQVRTVIMADGNKRDLPTMGGMRIEICGRQMICDAYVTPAGTMPLIGQIPLEYLDLVVDPNTREVRVFSEDGPRAHLLRVAA